MFRKLRKELGVDDKAQDNGIGIAKSFWIDDEILHYKEFKKTHGNCCLNHQIGLPRSKISPYKEMPLFDYEVEIIQNIESHKDYALNKARGIGATELILRWILFQALKNEI